MNKSYLVILILIQPFSTILIVNHSLNVLASDQNRVNLSENPFSYPLNTLLSVSDSRWPHHVEPTMAIGDNGVIFVGWKNALEHDGGGQSVGFTYSNDSINWQYPYDMASAWSTGSIQSDPWMVYFNHTLYYSYLEFPTGEEGQGQISFSHTSNLGTNWKQVRASYGTGYYADKETFAISNDGIIYLVYSDVHTSEDFYFSWVRLSRSFDGGNTFIDNVTISDKEGIDVGANVLPEESGNVYLCTKKTPSLMWEMNWWGVVYGTTPIGPPFQLLCSPKRTKSSA
ncbi:MAG: hypothetical protein ACFFC7_13280 [Candidatus Hermodarchaeota archaeon]